MKSDDSIAHNKILFLKIYVYIYPVEKRTANRRASLICLSRHRLKIEKDNYIFEKEKYRINYNLLD
jgi:hypothetical protein